MRMVAYRMFIFLLANRTAMDSYDALQEAMQIDG